MTRKMLIGGAIVGMLAATLVVAGVATNAFAQGTNPPAQAAEQADTGPDEQIPSYDSSVRVGDAQYEGMSEADEAAALESSAKIEPEEAKAAALNANPGATVVKVELDNENGALVYSVELSNGQDVKVDAGNGAILSTEQDNDNEAGDADNVQEEVESQADDADEPGDVDENDQEDADGQAEDALAPNAVEVAGQ
jgi:uncharacterized membrane protein YkoI